MQRWEYMTLVSQTNYGSIKYHINGELNTQLKNVALPTVLNQCGAQGWEMISTRPVSQNEFMYIFKRPVRPAGLTQLGGQPAQGNNNNPPGGK
ncbi:MAG: DUF4177 domain-containing protein [Anaerolineae bacterium]|jgi:hypothetical protein|nr:DUF4177 domain-containing protein [Anaerolineae bacterium]